MINFLRRFWPRRRADTSSTLPATPEEHGQLRDTIAARRQAGGPVPPGQPYIVGNGDREGFYRS